MELPLYLEENNMTNNYCVSSVASLVLLSASFGLSASTEAHKNSVYWDAYLESRSAGTDLYDSSFLPGNIDILTNFSYAGFERGEKPIPTLTSPFNQAKSDFDSATGYKVFKVDDYGAAADNKKSDKQAIKKTIKAAEDYVSSNKGAGAIIYFSAGRYLINEKSDMRFINATDKDAVANEQVIKITKSNIILRGAGQGETELFMSESLYPIDNSKMWTTPRILSFSVKRAISAQTPVTSEVISGTTKSLQVKSSDHYKVADWIRLNSVITRHEVIEKEVAPYKLEKSWTALNSGLKIHEYHQIKSITKNKLTFYTPIQVNIESEDSWSIEKHQPLENVGLEALTIRGNWQDKFKHHHRSADGTIHDSAWSLVVFANVVNSWVRKVTFVDFNAALQLRDSAYSTVKDITLKGNSGHLSLQFTGSFNNVSINVDDQSATWHAPGFSHASSSNVHFKTQFKGDTSSDLHGAQPRINLFDNVKGGWVYGRWGAAVSNQPNHLKGLVYWNFENIGKAVKDFELMRKNNRYGRLIAPYMIGNHGAPIHFASMKPYSDYTHSIAAADYQIKLADQPQAILESAGQPVYPQSLYQAQVKLRLGYLPQWLK